MKVTDAEEMMYYHGLAKRDNGAYLESDIPRVYSDERNIRDSTPAFYWFMLHEIINFETLEYD